MSSEGWNDPGLAAVAALVRAETGLAYASGRTPHAEAAIQRGMARARISDASAYHQQLLASRASLDDLIAEFTVGETYFFRDPDQLGFIRDSVLPEIRRRRGPEHRVRAWSAGCASGEEAYTIGMLLEEAGLAGRAEILATDVSRHALEKARRGLYGSWSLRGDEGGRLADRYFHRQGQRFAVAERLRQGIRFAQLNLAGTDYPSAATGTGDLDLILCRNVLIYFGPETVWKVGRKLLGCLADGGWLVTGASDPPLPETGDCEVVTTPGGLFYRRRPKALHPSALPLPAAGQPATRVSTRPLAPAAPPAAVSGREATARAEHSQASNRPASRLRQAAPTMSRPTPPASRAPIERARAAFSRGDYLDAAELAKARTTDPDACALRIRALANLGDLAGAERASSQAVMMHALAPELHYLRAVVLTRRGRREEAIRCLRRVIYLDRGLAVAHTTLGLLLQQEGDRKGALSAFRTAQTLAASCPPDSVLPLSEGETAAQLAKAASDQVRTLERAGGDSGWQ